MFNFIKINESQPQKKLFTVQNYDLLNSLIKDEAATINSTESTIIESHLLSAYLNPCNDELVFPVVNYLFSSQNGIASTSKAVFEWFSSKPEYANDSLLALLDYIETLEIRHRTVVNGKEPALRQLAKYATLFKDQIDKYGNQFHSFNGPYDSNVHIDRFDHMILDTMSDAPSNYEDINLDGSFSTLINTIRKYWYFGGETDTAGIRNWICTYKMLASICDLASWPDYPQYRFELVHIVRSITVSDGKQGTYDSSSPVLTKQVFLAGGKSFITTEDAIILQSPSKKAHTNAERVIHGPQGRSTLLPFIITFTDDEYDHIDEIATTLVQENQEAKKEFPNIKDVHCVPIYFEGRYNDHRVKWKTI